MISSSAEVRLLIRLLERKFGELSEEIRQNFYSLETEAILECVEELATAEKLEDFLAKFPKKSPELAEVILDDASTVVRTREGLMIMGTRLSLYDILDYVKQGWASDHIQKWFRLNPQQIFDIFEYIEHHQEQVEADYQQILQCREEQCQDWGERNRELLIKMKTLKPGRREFWATLRQRRIERREE